MSTRTSYVPGTPSWVDVMVPNRDAAKNFYGALFGWTFEEMTDPESGNVVYVNCSSNGHLVCGMMELSAEMQAGGMPAVWSTYIDTADADETASRVTAAGGAVIMPVMDVFDIGRMAMFTDPTGAAFGIWQAKIHMGEWNDYKIVAKGNHLQQFINGHQTVDITDEDAAHAAKSGVLALQLHVGGAMTIQFKDVQLKELK